MFANLVPSILKGSKIVQSFVIKNSGPILTTVGCAALVASSVSMYKAAVKVKIEKEKAEEKIAVAKDEETIKQIKKAAAIKVTKIMLAPVLFAGICAFCIISNNYIHLKKQAGLAAAYALSEQTLKDYEDSLEPIVGKKKAEQVREDVAKKDMNRLDGAPIIDTGHGTQLFFEPKTGRWFRSSHDYIRLKFAEANNRVQLEDNVALDDVLQDLGLEVTDLGQIVGWNQSDGCDITVDLRQTTMYHGPHGEEEPATYMTYSVRPLTNTFGDYDWHHRF